MQEIEGTIVKLLPKRGKGPGVVVIELPLVEGDSTRETLDLTTFDPNLIRVAAGSINSTAKVTYEDKTSKDGSRTFHNLMMLTVLDSPESFSEISPNDALVAPGHEISPVGLSPYTQTINHQKNSSTPYVLFDRADDDAILAKLKGAVLESIVYCFKQQDKKVYGLGIDGAEACKRELAREGEVIEEEQVSLIKEDNAAAYFEARASRWAIHSQTGNRIKLDSALGFKRQDKFTPSGGKNPFWYEAGASKAMRNAILRLTPEGIKMRLIEMYKEHAKQVEE